MTRLDRSQMEGGFLGLYVDAKFDVKNSSNGDNGGGNAGCFSSAGNLYYVHSVSPDLKLGRDHAIAVVPATKQLAGHTLSKS